MHACVCRATAPCVCIWCFITHPGCQLVLMYAAEQGRLLSGRQRQRQRAPAAAHHQTRAFPLATSALQITWLLQACQARPAAARQSARPSSPTTTTPWPRARAKTSAAQLSAQRDRRARRRSWRQRHPRRRSVPPLPPPGRAALLLLRQPTTATLRWRCSASRWAAMRRMLWSHGWWAAWALPCCCSTICSATSPRKPRQALVLVWC